VDAGSVVFVGVCVCSVAEILLFLVGESHSLIAEATPRRDHATPT